MSRALIIVDVQPTFTEGGALGVAGGEKVARNVAKYAVQNADKYDLVVTTQDWHVDPGHHFSDNPDFVDTWPPHGVAGTSEAELHPELSAVNIDYRVKKGEYEAAYSGFEGTCPDGTSLEDVLESEGINEVDVVGLALSHCVKDTALDAAKLKWLNKVRVLTDLTAPVSVELGEQALEELGATRVILADSRQS